MQYSIKQINRKILKSKTGFKNKKHIKLKKSNVGNDTSSISVFICYRSTPR